MTKLDLIKKIINAKLTTNEIQQVIAKAQDIISKR